MKIGDKIYFTPGTRYSQLAAVKDNATWYGLFFERLEVYFLQPVELLNEKQYGFAALLILFAAFEYMACIHEDSGLSVGDRTLAAMKKSNLFPADQIGRIYGNYRCGLVHEGRLKDGMAAGYGLDELYCSGDKGRGAVIDPSKFLIQVRAWVAKVKEQNLPAERRAHFGAIVRAYHEVDIALA